MSLKRGYGTAIKTISGHSNSVELVSFVSLYILSHVFKSEILRQAHRGHQTARGSLYCKKAERCLFEGQEKKKAILKTFSELFLSNTDPQMRLGDTGREGALLGYRGRSFFALRRLRFESAPVLSPGTPSVLTAA